MFRAAPARLQRRFAMATGNRSLQERTDVLLACCPIAANPRLHLQPIAGQCRTKGVPAALIFEGHVRQLLFVD